MGDPHSLPEITVYAEPPGDYITVTADTESYVSPFETTLRVDGTFDFRRSLSSLLQGLIL